MQPAHSRDAYTLYVQLAEIEPAIWRRMSVPGHLTLHQLHYVFQVTMGWTNSHLHQFIVPGKNGSTYYGKPSPEDNYFPQDEQLVSLARIAPKKGVTFVYEYDFGDSWQHEVAVEQIDPRLEDAPPYPWCLGGKRACPPEDIGGVVGYQEFVEAWRDRRHPDHLEMREWVGKHWKPELFSVQQANAGLALLISIFSNQ